MEPRWSRIVAFVLVIFVLVLGLKMYRQIYSFLSTMGSIGVSRDPREITIGLIAVGLIGAMLVSVVRILTHNGGKGS